MSAAEAEHRPGMATNLRPLALGYLRLYAADSPEVAAQIIAELHTYAEQEGLTLADVYTDLLDPPADRPGRSAFCAMMDALRSGDAYAVIISEPEHLSRLPGSYDARRTIIEAEAGARLIVIHPRVET